MVITDNEFTNLSDEIDNSSDKHVYDDLYLELGSAAFTGTDSGIEIYLVPVFTGADEGIEVILRQPEPTR